MTFYKLERIHCLQKWKMPGAGCDSEKNTNTSKFVFLPNVTSLARDMHINHLSHQEGRNLATFPVAIMATKLDMFHGKSDRLCS